MILQNTECYKVLHDFYSYDCQTEFSFLQNWDDIPYLLWTNNPQKQTYKKKTKLAALSIVPQQNCKVLLKILENSENIFTNNKDIAISRLQICNSACKSLDSSNSPQVWNEIYRNFKTVTKFNRL